MGYLMTLVSFPLGLKDSNVERVAHPLSHHQVRDLVGQNRQTGFFFFFFFFFFFYCFCCSMIWLNLWEQDCVLCLCVDCISLRSLETFQRDKGVCSYHKTALHIIQWPNAGDTFSSVSVCAFTESSRIMIKFHYTWFKQWAIASTCIKMM